MYIEVILPLQLPKLYSYSVPTELEETVQVGCRVVVQFGKKKIYTALTRRVHQGLPEFELKDILSVLDNEPIIQESHFKFWDWVAEYYLCTSGDVMNAALPSGLKLESESKIEIIHSDDQSVRENNKSLKETEKLILEVLELKKSGLTIEELAHVLKRKNIFAPLHSLQDKGLIKVSEHLKSGYSPKTEKYIRFTEQGKNEEFLQAEFLKIERRSPKQLEQLMTFIRLTQDKQQEEIKLQLLLQVTQAKMTAIQALVKKGILEIVSKEEEYVGSASKSEAVSSIQFTNAQENAYQSLKLQLKKNKVTLLHGVTSSGKTEIYIKLMEEVLRSGRQVLYLLPEIALTSQIIRRLKKYFGDQVGVFHSRFSENEKGNVWNAVRKSGKVSKDNQKGMVHQVILGARSSLFLPFSNLGLIIVDEEHDRSYKQKDPAPRYHARDAAIVLGAQMDAPVLLGSATPSLESFYNVSNSKFGYVELNERYGGLQMPKVQIADVKEAKRKKEMKSIFTPELLDSIQQALNQKEQVILFQNRRGFAPYLECRSCGWTPHCVNCDVSLVLHKQSGQLRCHYCGFHQEAPSECIRCGESAVLMMGFGTEKIEEELHVFFPDAKVSRLDLDSAKSRSAHQHIISDFENRSVDILVGTQMVTKGLDFDNVSTVGIMDADSMLKFPDFRAHENSFQLMAQVSGRSGRKQKQGKVIIQTKEAQHPILQQVINHDYKGFYTSEINERNQYRFPPLVRLVEITVRHKEIGTLSKGSNHLANSLRSVLGKAVLGPELPLVARVRNLYVNVIRIKIEKNLSLPQCKEIIRNKIHEFRGEEKFRNIFVHVDVDPF